MMLDVDWQIDTYILPVLAAVYPPELKYMEILWQNMDDIVTIYSFEQNNKNYFFENSHSFF